MKVLFPNYCQCDTKGFCMIFTLLFLFVLTELVQPAPAQEPMMILGDYLYGSAYYWDCYFTVEESDHPNRPQVEILSRRIQARRWDSFDSIQEFEAELVRVLSQQNISVLRDREGGRIFHLVDKLLLNTESYALDDAVKLTFQGTLNELIDHLAQAGIAIHRARGFVGPIPPLDDGTPVSMSMNEPMKLRGVLSNYIPLSEYDRILWMVNSRTNEKGKEVAAVRFRGKSRLQQSTDVNKMIPFGRGEIAYRSNDRNDATTVSAREFIKQSKGPDFINLRWAIRFIGEVNDRDGMSLLFDKLDYRYPSSNLLIENYPAVKALREYGQDAREEARKQLSLEPDPLRLRLLKAIVNGGEENAGSSKPHQPDLQPL